MTRHRSITIAAISVLTLFACLAQTVYGLRMVSYMWPLTGYKMFAGDGLRKSGRYVLEGRTRSGRTVRVGGRHFGIDGRQFRASLELHAAHRPGGRELVRRRLARVAAIWNSRHPTDPFTALGVRVYDLPPPPGRPRLRAAVTWRGQ